MTTKEQILTYIESEKKSLPSKKKITRGISKEFADAFKKSDLFKLYENHKDELFIGVRNNYLNLYYNCDSIAKIKFTYKKVRCEIDKYYLEGNHFRADGEKRITITPAQICRQYEDIKKHSNAKATSEKKPQSKLVILNNENKASNWFCIDVEYIKQFNNQKEKDRAGFGGRFDIIALSKAKPHKVALIELKYGSGVIGGKSGIYKHVDDFYKFNSQGFFEGHLQQEIIEIIKSQKDLGIFIPFEIPNVVDLLAPEFFFIVLNNNAKEGASTPKQTMSGYLFKDYRWNCKKLSTTCVENTFGDITLKANKFHATFLFSKATIESLNIADIIDGEYDERIVPS